MLYSTIHRISDVCDSTQWVVTAGGQRARDVFLRRASRYEFRRHKKK